MMSKLFAPLATATALLLGAASAAQAAPVGYEGDLTQGTPVTGSVGGTGWFTNTASQTDFWQFAGSTGQAVSLVGTPLDARLDLAFSVYRGASAALGQFLNNSDWAPQGPDFLDFAFGTTPGQTVSIARLVLPATDVYTVAIGGFFSQGAGPFGYRLSLTAAATSPGGTVPLPSTALLLGLGILGLFGARRQAGGRGCNQAG